MARTLEADYVVIGAGAMGMAFTDTLLTETNATVAIIDRYHQPGGHWNTAYPFVRLHQPSVFYGVNSRHLGNDTIDHCGWNEGLYELATCGEVCAYFDQVMNQQFLPTGRVAYHPMSDYQGSGRFASMVSGETFEATARKRFVDASYMRVTVPSMRPPPYEVAQGVTCIAPNDLPKIRARHSRYVVVGAGKTGMDACLWLIGRGVAPADMTWIMPRDSWVLDRARVQPGERFREEVARTFTGQAQAVFDATSVPDLFDRLEACGALVRFSRDVRPTMYRCATVSQRELTALRQIGDIVRKGRVRRITADAIELDGGTIPATPGALYVDCTADGLERRPETPVFAPGQITLQAIRTCQQVFSAALIAHVEAAYGDDAVRNEICKPVPHPDSDLDWLRATIANDHNALRWSQDAGLRDWLAQARLDFFGHLAPQPEEPRLRETMARQVAQLLTAQIAKLGQLMAAEG